MKTDATMSKHRVTLTKQQNRLLEKYHSSIALNSSTGDKMAVKAQNKLMKEIAVQIEEIFKKDRIKQAMIQEKEDYWREQNQEMNERLLESIKKFKQSMLHENAVLNYVLDQEAQDSDEDFNVFDKMAGDYNDEEVKAKLLQQLRKKIDKVKKAVEDEEGTQERLEMFIDENNL